LNVSPTELKSLLKQAFEGMGFSQGTYQHAAEAVLWCEMRGLEGLQTLAADLSLLDPGVTLNPLSGARSSLTWRVP